MMEIAGLLAAAGATAHRLDPAHQLVAACMRADRATAEALLAADPGLVARAADPLWGNPLLRAAFLGRPDAVVLGVHVGFPLDDVDQDRGRELAPQADALDPRVSQKARLGGLEIGGEDVVFGGNSTRAGNVFR